MNVLRLMLYRAGTGAIALGLTSCGGFAANPTSGENNAASVGDALRPHGQSRKMISFQPSLPGPYAGLTLTKAGLIVGTTQGMTCSQQCQANGGVFQVTAGAIQPIYAFKGWPDGANPQAGVTEGPHGVLYGTTVLGGGPAPRKQHGTVYELVPSGSTFTEHVIYSFEGASDGNWPIGGLFIDKSGALYGMTYYGGSAACTGGCGIAYRITGSGGQFHETILYKFHGPPDGANPRGNLVRGSGGTFYGTTFHGGTGRCGKSTCGTIIKLAPSGSGYAESVVYSFKGPPGDGANPSTTLLSAGKGGVFYGATYNGGAKNLGTVYKLTCSKACKEKVLHSFTAGGTDGASPRDDAGLIADATGILYGTTTFGGTKGTGTVFSVNPSTQAESVLHNFSYAPKDGQLPDASLLLIGGSLYGTTYYGGTGGCYMSVYFGCGTVFIQNK